MNIREITITLEDGLKVSFDSMHGIIVPGNERPLTEEEDTYLEHLLFIFSNPFSLT